MWSDESLRLIEHKLQRLVLEKKYPKCSLLFKISYINVVNVWKHPPLVTSSFAEDWITYRSMQNDLGYTFYLRSLLANDLWHRKTPEPAKNLFMDVMNLRKTLPLVKILFARTWIIHHSMRNDSGYRFHMLISSNKPSIEPNNGWNFSKFLKYLLWASNMGQRLSGRRPYISIYANATASAYCHISSIESLVGYPLPQMWYPKSFFFKIPTWGK
jgi:hypothetical protein